MTAAAPGRPRVQAVGTILSFVLGLALCLAVAPLSDAGAETAEQADASGDAAPAPLKLTEAELKALAGGEDVIRHRRQAEFASALVVFDVAATPRQVWRVLNTFADYPGWIDDLEETEIYRSDGSGVYVRFEARTPFGTPWIWFARHSYPTAREATADAVGLWELDMEYRSSFRAAHGYWQVTALPERPGMARVIYASNIRLRGVTALFRGIVLRGMIREGPAWLRRALAVP